MTLFHHKSTRVRKAKFKDIGDILVNPYQGWYRPYLFNLGTSFDAEEMRWCMVEQEPLCLVECDLSAFASGEISGEGLCCFQEILHLFETYQKQIILRFAYDFVGKAMEKEPTSMDIIFTHMNQIAEATTNYASMILCYQGLWIGNWGEMHSSRYATASSLSRLYQHFRLAFGPEVFLAVRRLDLLAQWQVRDNKVTLFDDGMFGSTTDLGTFAGARADGLRHLSNFTGDSPVGGEALAAGLVAGSFTKQEIIETFEKLHLSYLNSQYEGEALQYLKKHKLWDSLCKYLGYRLCVTDVEVVGTQLQLVLSNVGYGSVFYPMDFQLSDDQGTVIGEGSITGLGARESAQISFALPMKSTKLYLAAQMNRRYPVRFANEGGPLVYVGELLHA